MKENKSFLLFCVQIEYRFSLLVMPECQKMYFWMYTQQRIRSAVYLPSLIRIFIGHILDSQGCKVSSCAQERLIRLR